MSILSNDLRKGEQIVLEAKVHWATLIIPGIFTMAYGIGIFWLVPRLIAFLKTELSLSSKRLVGKTGLINTKSMDSPLNKINSISVESGLLGKIFGYGTIIVNTASTTYSFKYMKDANSVKSQIFNEIDQCEETRINDQAQNIATAMNNSL